jgi:hypothetical protein
MVWCHKVMLRQKTADHRSHGRHRSKTFTWTNQGKRQSTSVMLRDVKEPRAGTATVNFTLVWRSSTGKEVEVPLAAARPEPARRDELGRTRFAPRGP